MKNLTIPTRSHGPINMAEEDDEEVQPVSPVSQIMLDPCMDLIIHVVLEYEKSFMDARDVISGLGLATMPRLSCLMKQNKSGALTWVKTEADLHKHVFSAELQDEESVQDYLNKVMSKPFDTSRPLWEVHILHNITSRIQTTLIFRLHHCMGDGISVMSSLGAAAFSAKDPLKKPTFPVSSNLKANHELSTTSGAFGIVKTVKNTIADVVDMSLRMIGWRDDTKFPTKQPKGLRLQTFNRSSITFPLADIKAIKTKIQGTVNDVITGIIFYGYQRYLQISLAADLGNVSIEEAYGRISKHPSATTLMGNNSTVTAIMTINTRMLQGIHSINELVMMNDAQWGNKIAVLPIPVPVGDLRSPLDAVKKAKQSLDRYKKAPIFLLNYILVKHMPSLLGFKAYVKGFYNLMASTSIIISNVAGPTEKITMGGNPLDKFSFFVSGLPQALQVYIASYMDEVVIHIGGYLPYINTGIFTKCLNEAYEELLHDAVVQCNHRG